MIVEGSGIDTSRLNSYYECEIVHSGGKPTKVTKGKCELTDHLIM